MYGVTVKRPGRQLVRVHVSIDPPEIFGSGPPHPRVCRGENSWTFSVRDCKSKLVVLVWPKRSCGRRQLIVDPNWRGRLEAEFVGTEDSDRAGLTKAP